MKEDKIRQARDIMVWASRKLQSLLEELEREDIKNVQIVEQ